MDIKTATRVVNSARTHPAVTAAAERLDVVQRQADQVSVALNGDVNTRRTLYSFDYQRLHEVQSFQCQRPALNIGLMAGMGGLLATGISVLLLPPTVGLLSIGMLVASVRWVPRKVGDYVYGKMVEKRVDDDLTRVVQQDHTRVTTLLEAQRRLYDTTVRDVQAQMLEDAERLAQEGQARLAAEPDIKVDEQQVRIGGILVPRNNLTPAS